MAAPIVGIYEGAGFVTLSEEGIAANDLTMEIRKKFSKSIEKVWGEPVDIMLGNHPFHNDTWKGWLQQIKDYTRRYLDEINKLQGK